MKFLRQFLVLFFTFFCVSVLAPAQASAWDPFGGVRTECTGSARSSAVCQDSGTANNPLTGTDGLIMQIANIIALVAGAIAVIIIILSALRFTTSGGSSEDIAGARRTLTYAIVGLVVLALARSLVALILSKLN